MLIVNNLIYYVEFMVIPSGVETTIFYLGIDLFYIEAIPKKDTMIRWLFMLNSSAFYRNDMTILVFYWWKFFFIIIYVYSHIQGTDNTVFFLSIGDNYEPIGFIRTPSAVTHLEWTPSDFVSNILI